MWLVDSRKHSFKTRYCVLFYILLFDNFITHFYFVLLWYKVPNLKEQHLSWKIFYWANGGVAAWLHQGYSSVPGIAGHEIINALKR